MKRSLGLLLTSLTVSGFAAGCDVPPPDDEVAATESELRRGAASAARPEVGLVALPGGGLCTGTLVGPRTVLTAAHCVGFRNAPIDNQHRATFVVSGTADYRNGHHHRVDGWRSIGKAIPNADSNFGAFLKQSDDDVALLHLMDPVTYVAPAAIANGMPGRLQRVTVFGYGLHGCTARGQGGSFDGQKRQFSFIYKNETFPACPGDSGGPYFNANGAIFATVVGIGRDPVQDDWQEVRSRLIDDLPRIRNTIATWQ